MIPKHITAAHIKEAIRRIIRDGMPRERRRNQRYCLVTTKGEHLPPKYTIAMAHEVATGELLRCRFWGGSESNKFLCGRGFKVIPCPCRSNSIPDKLRNE